jgi:parallel beta-helix repeat protein
MAQSIASHSTEARRFGIASQLSKAFFFLLLFLGFAFAISLPILPEKTELNGARISTTGACEYTNTEQICRYVLTLPSSTSVKTTLKLTDLKTLKKTGITDVNIYEVLSSQIYSEKISDAYVEDVYEVVNKTLTEEIEVEPAKEICNGTGICSLMPAKKQNITKIEQVLEKTGTKTIHAQYITKVNYTTSAKKKDYDAGAVKTYILEITRPITETKGKKLLPQQDFFNITFANLDIDPDISACGSLTTAGATYTLTGNITISGATCFTIAAPNITLDCNGYSITGNNASGTFGISSSQFNTTIRNCIIDSFPDGIFFHTAQQAKLENNTIRNAQKGLNLNFLNGANIIGNNISASGSSESATIWFGNGGTGTYNINITNNTLMVNVSYSGHGVIYLTNISNITISGNNITSYGTMGIFRTISFAGGTNVRMIGNRINAYGGSGIHMTNSGAKDYFIDCNGENIIGNNSSGTYGIYTNQINTTIKNCNISNFQHGVYFNGATNGAIENTNASTTHTSGYGIFFSSSTNNTIINSTGTSNSSTGIQLSSNSNYNTIINSTGTSTSSRGIYLGASSNNIITNSTGTSNTNYGIYLYSSSNNTISGSIGISNSNRGITIQLCNNTNIANTIAYSISGIAFISDNSNYTTINNITGNSNSSIGIYIYQSPYALLINSRGNSNSSYASIFDTTQNSTIANSTFVSGSAYSIYLISTTNSIFYNNTLSSTTTLLYLDANSGNNLFYWNNFTNTAGYYVQDLNGSNYYNTTIGGLPAGNIWHEVINGSIWVTGSRASEFSGLYYGDKGIGYPYSNLKTAKLNGNIIDFAPLTPFINYAPGNITINTTNLSTLHGFNFTASVYDENGGSDILTAGVSSTLGTCAINSNMSVGNYFFIHGNCTTTLPLETNLTITFTDRSNSSINKSIIVVYPDHPASLTQPTLNSPLYLFSIATCTNGSFSDIDGDTENVSSRTWKWYKNGVLQTPTTQSINLTTISAKPEDKIKCEEWVSANYWVTSNASNQSNEVEVSHTNPLLASITATPACIKTGSINVSTVGAISLDEEPLQILAGTTSGASNLCISSFGNPERSCTFNVENYWTDTNLHTIYAFIRDNFGYTSDVKSYNIYTDNTGPNAPNNTNPTSGHQQGTALVSFSWDAPADVGCNGSISSYTIKIYNGSACLSQITSTNTSSTSYSTSLPEGTYSWKVAAIDGFGNVGAYTACSWFKVDLTPPIVNITSPPNHTLFKKNFNITYSVYDITTTTCSLSTNKNNEGWVSRGSISCSAGITEIDVIHWCNYVGADVCAVRVSATDAIGRTSNAEGIYSIELHPTDFNVTRPEFWKEKYYLPGSNITINWTESQSLVGGGINYTVYVYRNDSTLSQTINAGGSLSAVFNNTGVEDWYYAVVSACDTLVGFCTNATSNVFGVFTPAITIDFGASAYGSGVVSPTGTFTEYCSYLFYPTGSGAEVAAELRSTPSGILMHKSSNYTPGTMNTNLPLVFNPAPYGNWIRDCYAKNVWGHEIVSGTRTATLTPPAAPPSTGAATTTHPINRLEIIAAAAIALLILFGFAFFADLAPLGVLASVLLILLGVWVYFGSIYVQTGEVDVGQNTIMNVTGADNSTTTIVYTNATKVYQYDKIEVPYLKVIGIENADAGNVAGFVLLLLALYGMLHFALLMFKR